MTPFLRRPRVMLISLTTYIPSGFSDERLWISMPCSGQVGIYIAQVTIFWHIHCWSFKRTSIIWVSWRRVWLIWVFDSFKAFYGSTVVKRYCRHWNTRYPALWGYGLTLEIWTIPGPRKFSIRVQACMHMPTFSELIWIQLHPPWFVGVRSVPNMRLTYLLKTASGSESKPSSNLLLNGAPASHVRVFIISA